MIAAGQHVAPMRIGLRLRVLANSRVSHSFVPLEFLLGDPSRRLWLGFAVRRLVGFDSN